MVHVFNHLNQKKLADKVKALSRDVILYLALLLAPGNEPGLMLMLAFAQAIRILVKVQIKHKIRVSAVRGCFFWKMGEAETLHQVARNWSELLGFGAKMAPTMKHNTYKILFEGLILFTNSKVFVELHS